MNRPNIIFILSDQHNAKVSGYNGHSVVKTPNIDQLTQEGVCFSNAVTQNPICTPSRVSFLSGQYCHNHGYYGLEGPNPQGLPSLPGQLKKHGYRTAAIGKIHCPADWVEADCDLFLETMNCSVGGNPEYTEYLAERHLLDKKDKGVSPTGGQSLDGRPSNLNSEDQPDAWAVRKGIEFIGDCQTSQEPFFLHLSFNMPHQLYMPSKPFWDMYPETDLEMPPNFSYDLTDKAPHLRQTVDYYKNNRWTEFEPTSYEAGMKRKMRGYLGNISEMDSNLGKLLSYLKAHNLADNTILVYSADHGDYACEHGLPEKAPGICADAITRIPFIWRWPGHFKAGYEAEELVEAVDLTTTLCNLAGVEALETSDGKDLSQLLQGEKQEVHKIAVTEFSWSKSVRKANYRLVYYPVEMFAKEYPDGFGELYDLNNDPWEMKNLYFNEDFQTIVAELKQDLFDWLLTTTRPRTLIPKVLAESSQKKDHYKNTVNADGKVHHDYIRKLAANDDPTGTPINNYI
jgi:choline-sulfatase/uncharacterized sulfatase